MKYGPLSTVLKPALEHFQTVVRIFARILATGFTVAVHRSEGRQWEVR